MTENDDYQIKCICEYCGNHYQEDNFPYLPAHREPRIKSRCKRCWPLLKQGIRIKYTPLADWYSGVKYANKHLTSGEVYTVSKARNYVDVICVCLEGFGELEFYASLFTPEHFVNTKGEKS